MATAVAIKLTLRLLSRIGMGAVIASAGWVAGIVVSLACSSSRSCSSPP